MTIRTALGRARSSVAGARRRVSRHALAEVFLTVSGANRDVLRDAPKERTKQVAMGAVLMATAAIAAVAATYALHLALHFWWPFAILGGIAWGLVILNLDRWLVVSTPRLKTKRGTLAMALPRVLLAVLIGAVISTPLTLAVFSAEISTEVQVMAAEEEQAFNDQLQRDSRYSQLPEMRQRVADLERELREGSTEADVINHPAVEDLQRRLDEVTVQYNVAAAALQCEIDGTCGTGVPGIAAAAEQKLAERDRLRQERDALTRQLEELKAQVREQLGQQDEWENADAEAELPVLRAEIADIEQQWAQEIADHRAAVGNGDGILARLTALGRISDKDPVLETAHLLLFLFMTTLECLPIIFKTMLALAPPSLYERLVALEEEKREQRVRLRLQTEYEEAETLARSALAAAEARAARTLEAESRATGMVLDAQLDVTRDGVRRWRDEQLGRGTSGGTPSAEELDSLYLDDQLGSEDRGDGRLAGSPSAPV